MALPIDTTTLKTLEKTPIIKDGVTQTQTQITGLNAFVTGVIASSYAMMWNKTYVSGTTYKPASVVIYGTGIYLQNTTVNQTNMQPNLYPLIWQYIGSTVPQSPMTFALYQSWFNKLSDSIMANKWGMTKPNDTVTISKCVRVKGSTTVMRNVRFTGTGKMTY